MLTSSSIDIQNTGSNDGHRNFAYECAYYSKIKIDYNFLLCIYYFMR